jgi:uncharacterized protein YhaN
MRLTELTLERYGAFAERSINIPLGTGLTIIYGPNEAGKSTWLSAISDFLFGIPERTPNGAVFGYEGMRLGATVVDASGNAVVLRRRRGRGRTLTDADGAPLEDSVLIRMLGATTRDRFTTLFGLDHETLRSGGARLLNAEGDIGRLIVEAGGGLRSLMARLDEVDGEADKLFAPRRSGERAFYQALDTFDAADREVKLHTVTRDAYEQARKAAAGAEAGLTNLRADRQAEGAEISRLERLVRAVPHLLELDHLAVTLDALSDLAHLPDDFHDLVGNALEKRKVAGDALDLGRAKRDRLETRYDNLAVEPILLDAEVRIRDLSEQTIHVRKERADRPNRSRDLEDAERQLASLRRMLQLTAEADLATRLPDQAALDRVQQLANQAIERGALLNAARERAAELQDRLSTLQRRVDAAVAGGFDKPSGYNAAQFSNLVAQAAAAKTASREAETANQAVSRSLAALGFESVDSLEAFMCPGAEELRAEQIWHGELEAQLADQIEHRVEADTKSKIARDAIAQLEAPGTVASDAALAEARFGRGAAWAPLRAAYLGNEVPPDEERRRSSVESFEGMVSTADDIADRRASEAERAANLALARRQLAEGTAAYAASETLIEDLEKRRAARVKAWSTAFPDAVSRFPELIGLLNFAEQRRILIEALEAARLKVRNAGGLETELEPARLIFERALQATATAQAADQPLAIRVQTLNTVLGRHETEHTDYRRDLRDLETDRPTAERAREELQQLVADQEHWQQEWPSALSALGLSTDLAPQNAGNLISEWSSARATLGLIAQTQTRLSRMDRDEANLKDAAAALGSVLSLELPEDPAAASDLINARWKEQDGIRQQRTALAPELEEVRTEYAILENADRAAAEAVKHLAIQATVVLEGSALADFAVRCAVRSGLLLKTAQTGRSLADVADGFAVDALLAQLEGRGLDELRGALTIARERSSHLDDEIEEAILTHKSTRDALAQFAAETGVNAAIAARESAAARMQAVIERYVDLTVARGLIADAIDRIRNEQQDPLIRRAGELFSYTTRGGFSGIDCDIDDKGQPVVVGRRQSGANVPVAAMSDGTRDQMFLSFRLASLENYGASAEPLPFIADDLLVHFDDERSSATLDLLGQFGEANQVLLFTHHQSVRDDARRLEAQGVASVIEIERVA